MLGTLVALVPYAGLWLLVTIRLPHRDAPWTALIRGAAVFAVGLELLHAVVVYVITPWALAKQGTYGALGVAASLLVGLFLVSRLVVGAAGGNATQGGRGPPPAPAGPAEPGRAERSGPRCFARRQQAVELALELVEAPFHELSVTQRVL